MNDSINETTKLVENEEYFTDKLTLPNNDIEIKTLDEPIVQKPEVVNAVVTGGIVAGLGLPFVIIGFVLCITIIAIPIGAPLLIIGLYIMYNGSKSTVELYDEQNEKYKSQ